MCLYVRACLCAYICLPTVVWIPGKIDCLPKIICPRHSPSLPPIHLMLLSSLSPLSHPCLPSLPFALPVAITSPSCLSTFCPLLALFLPYDLFSSLGHALFTEEDEEVWKALSRSYISPKSLGEAKVYLMVHMPKGNVSGSVFLKHSLTLKLPLLYPKKTITLFPRLVSLITLDFLLCMPNPNLCLKNLYDRLRNKPLPSGFKIQNE